MKTSVFCSDSGFGYGVEVEGGLLYEADMTKATATRLAELCEEHPSNDWETQSRILKAEGFDLRMVHEPSARQDDPRDWAGGL